MKRKDTSSTHTFCICCVILGSVRIVSKLLGAPANQTPPPAPPDPLLRPLKNFFFLDMIQIF